jgi:hypothetical protein
MEYEADDGFAGTLSLDIATIKVEAAGTKTSSYTVTATRTYPHLSRNDTSLVPKTVTENGKTYTLSGVDWKSQAKQNADYDSLPASYTAVATYSAKGTSTKVTGYATTAEYSGTLAKLSQGKTVYTAYFEGEEIRTPIGIVDATAEQVATADEAALPEPTAEPTSAPTAEPTNEPTATPTLVPQPIEETSSRGAWPSATDVCMMIAIALAALAIATIIYAIKLWRTINEKTDNPADSPDHSNNPGDSGSGHSS